MSKKFKIYNTMTKQIESFKPINEDMVSLYSCGPTVYSTPHIGNMRAYSFVDLLVKVLKVNGYKVKNLINITDVGHLTSDADEGEDKLEKAAKANQKNAYEIAEEYTSIFYRYLEMLHIDKPSLFPKATDHIQEQIEMVKELEEKGFTYITSDGVYFDTSKFEDYSKLANIDIEGLREGERVELGEKKNKTDFALWKFSPLDKKRDMEWKSPWGKGFPGWHIECSAMARKHLGDKIDIHTGGIDHIPIHHTNEIAQTESITNDTFVNYWMHVNFLQLLPEIDTEVIKQVSDKGFNPLSLNAINNHKEEDVEKIQKSLNQDIDNAEIKMSKSKGTAYTIYQLVEKGFEPLALKYLYLSAHYRSELKFNFSILQNAQNGLNKLRNKVYQLKTNNSVTVSNEMGKYAKEFIDLLNIDLDTPKALAKFHEILNSDISISEKLNTVYFFDLVTGLDLLSYKPEDEEIPDNIIAMAEERLIAKQNKNWNKSDELRNAIQAEGYQIKDSKNGYEITKS